ncbi:hypothetical protein [Actinoplanes sp. NPDC020271]|uniref:hypothetical protein n=1 Tax=Actinoplanes sp. NPDC020271 TaxID=3363896 RepID=UPI00379BB602
MDPTIEDPDAQFAAFVADLRAHIDDPVKGTENRELLSEDPERLRALWDLARAAASGPPGPVPFAVVGYTVVLVVVALAVFAAISTKVGLLL